MYNIHNSSESFMLLQRGSRGDSVKQVQEKLNLTADGIFGLATENAVRAFQQEHNLQVTGAVGPRTWEVLFPEQISTDALPRKLTGIVPVQIINELPSVIATFNINTPHRLAHFLGQCAEESGNFQQVFENLNYSATALMRTFRRHFPTQEIAQQYARQPERIANLVYADASRSHSGRLGNVLPGDGWKYRGRGYIQLTGKNNYAAFNRFVPENILDAPDLVATQYPLLSAAWFWEVRNINGVADRGISDDVITSVTRVVNGGTHGLQPRIQYTKRFFNQLQ
jgi:putative chitinase